MHDAVKRFFRCRQTIVTSLDHFRLEPEIIKEMEPQDTADNHNKKSVDNAAVVHGKTVGDTMKCYIRNENFRL